MMRCRVFITIVLLLRVAAITCAGQAYLVTDRYVGSIYRLDDINDDSDALDANERILWGTGLSNAAELAAYRGGFLVVDSIAARILYYEDRNRDGDALDADESMVWTDGLANPFGIDVAPDGSAYLSDFATHQVVRALDTNQDGDALDFGERKLYADNIQGAVSVLATNNEQFVVAFNSGQVHLLQDSNSDGDALDAGENLSHTPNSITWVEGIAPRSGGGYYAGSWFYDAIYRVQDLNGDVDALDNAEVLTYADNFLGNFNDPWGMAAGPRGELLVANSGAGNVLALRDYNHDGDALDVGEVTTFADGFNRSVDIVAMPSFILGDFNFDGSVDAADYVVWRKGLGTIFTQSDFDIWRTHFGQTAGSGSGGGANAAVPEPSTLVVLVLAAVGVCSCRRRAAWKVPKTHLRVKLVNNGPIICFQANPFL